MSSKISALTAATALDLAAADAVFPMVTGGANRKASAGLLGLGAFLTPEGYGATADGAVINDVTLTAGSAVITTGHVFTAADVGKDFVCSFLTKTTAATITAANASITLANAPDAAWKYGPVWLDFNNNAATAIKTSVHNIAGAVITCLTAPTASGSAVAVLIGNASFNGKIAACGAGSATLTLAAPFSGRYGTMVFGTDSLPAFRLMRDAMISTGKPAVCAEGMYVWGTASGFETVYNITYDNATEAAQLTISSIAATAGTQAFTLTGTGSPSCAGVYFDPLESLPRGGSVIVSTVTAGVNGDAMLGCAQGTSWNSMNNVHVHLDGLTFVQCLDGTMTAVSLRNAMSASTGKLRFDVLKRAACSIKPSHSWNYAFRPPTLNNTIVNKFDLTQVFAHYVGGECREHYHFGKAIFQSCLEAVHASTVDGNNGYYSASFDRLEIAECAYGLVWKSATPSPLCARNVMIERRPPAGAAISNYNGIIDLPEWMDVVTYGADLSDPFKFANGAAGKIEYRASTQQGGVANTLSINGGTNSAATVALGLTITCLDGFAGQDIQPTQGAIDKATLTTFMPFSGSLTLAGAGDWELAYATSFSVVAAVYGTTGLMLYDVTAAAVVPNSGQECTTPNGGTLSQTLAKRVKYRTLAPAVIREQIIFDTHIGGGTLSFFATPTADYAGNAMAPVNSLSVKPW